MSRHVRDAVSAGGVVFRGQPDALELVLCGRQREQLWVLPKGTPDPGESLEESVRREIMEEAGIEVGQVRYHSSQPWPFPSALMIGCHAQGLSDEITMDTKELEDARWFSRAEARDMLSQNHADGLFTPFSFAIAHHLIRAYADGEV